MELAAGHPPLHGPLPAGLYVGFQLVDWGIHSWDIRQGTGRSHELAANGPRVGRLAVRLGVSVRSSYQVHDPRLGVRWMVERATAARQAALDALFVGDGHVTGPTPYYQNTPILARLLAEWGDAPAGAFFVVPLWNPVLLAEQVGVLASIAQGRFILQCGLGWGETTFAGMGVPLADRRVRFEAGLDILCRLLAGEQVTEDLPHPVRGARIAPLPPEPVEVWLAGHARTAVDRAARLGDGWLAGAEATDERARDLVLTYRKLRGTRPDAHCGGDPARRTRRG